MSLSVRVAWIFAAKSLSASSKCGGPRAFMMWCRALSCGALWGSLEEAGGQVNGVAGLAEGRGATMKALRGPAFPRGPAVMAAAPGMLVRGEPVLHRGRS